MIFLRGKPCGGFHLVLLGSWAGKPALCLHCVFAAAMLRCLFIWLVPKIFVLQGQMLGITLAAQHIDTAVAGNGVDPGGSRGLFGFVARGFLPNLDHHFLHKSSLRPGNQPSCRLAWAKLLSKGQNV